MKGFKGPSFMATKQVVTSIPKELSAVVLPKIATPLPLVQPQKHFCNEIKAPLAQSMQEKVSPKALRLPQDYVVLRVVEINNIHFPCLPRTYWDNLVREVPNTPLNPIFNNCGVTLEKIPDSLYLPKYLTQPQYRSACLVTVAVVGRYFGVSPEDIASYFGFRMGNIGVNISTMGVLVSLKCFQGEFDFSNTLPVNMHFDGIKNISWKDVKIIEEAVGMHNVNKTTYPPFRFAKPGEVVNFDKTTQNLTRQENPDFVREFSSPISGFVKQAYDQKVKNMNFAQANHVRGFSENLSEKTLKALSKFEIEITTWYEKNNNKETNVITKIFSEIKYIRYNFEKTQDESILIENYHNLEMMFRSFILENNLTMNLITNVSLENLNINPEVHKFLDQLFNRLYSEVDSPMLDLLSNVKQPITHNNFMGFLKSFALALEKSFLKV